MKQTRLLLLTAVAAVSGCASVPAQDPADLLIANVHIVDTAAGALSPPRDVALRDGRIVSISPAGAGPDAASIIDGDGRYLLAGLVDAHAHIGNGGIAPQDDASRHASLRQFLRYGVTSILVPGGTGGGDADLPALRAYCAAPGQCPGLALTGSLVTAPGSHPISTIFEFPPNVDDAMLASRGLSAIHPGTDIEALVAARRDAGATFLKIVIEDGPPPWYPKPRLSDAQVAALTRAAHARSMKVVAHVSDAAEVEIALAAGVDAIMHMPLDRMSDDLLRRMAARGMALVPTLALYQGFTTWGEGERESDPYALAGVPAPVIESLANPGFLAHPAEPLEGARRYLTIGSDNLRRAVAAGVPVLLGTDVNNPFVFPGYSMHEELGLAVAAGLTPAQALDRATRHSAAFLGFKDAGTVAPGNQADLILLAANPLEAIGNSRTIVTVLSDGAVVPDPVSLP